jgi:hypothetical protein
MFAVVAAFSLVATVASANQPVKEVKKVAEKAAAFCEKEGKQLKAKDKAECEHLHGQWKEPAADAAAAVKHVAPAAAPVAPAPAPAKK